MHAHTTSTITNDASTLAPMLASLRDAVGEASAGIVFVSGALARDAEGVAGAVRDAWPKIPALVVPAAGVLTDKGEIERAGASSAVLWKGGRAEVVAAQESPLLDALVTTAGARPATALLFCKPDWLDPDALDAALGSPLGADEESTRRLLVLGAGTVGPPAVGISAQGALIEAPAIALVVQGLTAPLVEASPACELLGDFAPIDEVSGGCVLRIGGRPALDALSACAARLRERTQQPLVFAAFTAHAGADGEGDEAYFIRPIRGIDPPRKGVFVGAEARVGARMTFGLRDPGASKANFQTASQRLHERAGGADPRFALFIDCAGRGEALYGTTDVDVRILRQRFADVPIAGMHSAFEIAPVAGGRSRVHFYTGVVALFRSPS